MDVAWFSLRQAGCIALLLLAGIAGCLDSAPSDRDGHAQPPAPVELLFMPPIQLPSELCQSNFCFEPTVAADAQGRILVTAMGEEFIAVTDDEGGNFTLLPRPPQEPPRSNVSDALITTDAEGRVFYVALVGENIDGARRLGSPGARGLGIQIASTTDGARTWETNVVVGLPEDATPADRPWLAARGDDVLVSFTQKGSAIGTTTELRAVRSSDGGRSFGEAFTIPHRWEGPAGPGGPIRMTSGPDPVRVGVIVHDSSSILFPNGGVALYEATDRLDDFTRRPLPDTWDASVNFWPALAEDPDRGWVLAWRSPAGEVMVARETIEGWTTHFSVGGPSPVAPHVVAADDHADIFWIRTEANGNLRQQVTRIAWEDDAPGDIHTVDIGEGATLGGQSSTDFAHGTKLDDDRSVVVYAREGGALLAIEQDPEPDSSKA